MISGETTLGAFWWYLPAILHDLRPHLIFVAVATVVLVAGAAAAAVLTLLPPAEQDGAEVDAARLVPMSQSRRSRRPHRTGAVCRTADNTIEVPR